MTSKRTHIQYKDAKALKSAGWRVEGKRCIRLHTNPQDETIAHAHAKASVGKVLAEAGYCVDSEVEHESGCVADIVAFGLEGRKPIVVELESEYSDELKQRNLKKYQHGPVAEVWTLPVDEFGNNIEHMQTYAKAKLGL